MNERTIEEETKIPHFSYEQQYLSWFREPIVQASPHPGHVALARLERESFAREGLPIVTMNVDGLHQRVGNRKCVRFFSVMETWQSIVSVCRIDRSQTGGIIGLLHNPSPSHPFVANQTA